MVPLTQSAATSRHKVVSGRKGKIMSAVPTAEIRARYAEHNYTPEQIEDAIPPQEVWDFIGETWDKMFAWRWIDHPELKGHTEALKWDNLPVAQQCHYFYDTAPDFNSLSDGIAHVIISDMVDQLGLVDPRSTSEDGLDLGEMVRQLQAMGIDVAMISNGTTEEKGLRN